MKPFLQTQYKIDRYTREGFWGLPTLYEKFERNAARYPDKEFLTDGRSRLTMSQASLLARRLALGLFELGYRRDDILVVQLPNKVEAALLRLASYASGIMVLPIVAVLGTAEMKHILTRSEARGIVIPGKIKDRDYFQQLQGLRSDLPRLEHIFMVNDVVPDGCISVHEMEQRPIETAFPPDFLEDKKLSRWEVQELTCTTGSTGLPKIQERFGSLFGLGDMHRDRWGLTEADVIGVPVPFAGGLAFNAWPPAINVPCKMAFVETFTPENVLRCIAEERVSVLIGVPSIGEMLLRSEVLQRYDVSSLRIFFTAGAPMPPSLAQEIEATLGCVVLGLLGSMDYGPIASCSIHESPEKRFFSVGKLVPGLELRILDEAGNDVPLGGSGEAVVRGPYVTTGYFKDPEMTLAACNGDVEGWFKTGDMLRVDEDGYVYVVGRIKDVIKRGGMTVAPAEIEDLLRTHQKVQEVVVVPMPDKVMVEKACAFVIPEPGQTFTFEEMVSFLRERNMATFKFPERLEIVQEFPMVGETKIARMKLTARVTEQLKAEGKI